MPQFVLDTFTDAGTPLLTAHTGETGATWADHPKPEWGGAYRLTGDGEIYCSLLHGVCYASGVPPSANYTVTAGLHIVTLGVDAIYICARMDTAVATMYMFRLSSDGSTWQLYKMVGGTATPLDSAAATVVEGGVYDLALAVGTGTQDAYVDGVLVCSATDTEITAAGRIGIRDTAPSSPTTGQHLTYISAATNDAPVVDAGADAAIYAGATFTRTVSFTDSDGVSTSWTATVDYGEGAGPVAATVNQGAKTVALANVYETEGVYTLNVTVTDNDGLSGSDTITVTVTEAPALGAFVVLSVPGTDSSAPVIDLGDV